MEGNYYEEVIQDIEHRRDELGVISRALRKLYNIPEATWSSVPAAGVAVNPVPDAAQTVRSVSRKAGRKIQDGTEKPIGKKCRLCLKTRILDEYPKAKHCPDGHEGTCKECKRKKAKGYKAPASSDAKTRTEKPCSACHITKPLLEFPKNKACADGHAGQCLKCVHTKATARWRAKHPPASSAGTEKGDLECRLCHASASSKGRLDSHMRTVHGGLPA